jgi:hypothetical protein
MDSGFARSMLAPRNDVSRLGGRERKGRYVVHHAEPFIRPRFMMAATFFLTEATPLRRPLERSTNGAQSW